MRLGQELDARPRAPRRRARLTDAVLLDGLLLIHLLSLIGEGEAILQGSGADDSMRLGNGKPLRQGGLSTGTKRKAGKWESEICKPRGEDVSQSLFARCPSCHLYDRVFLGF